MKRLQRADRVLGTLALLLLQPLRLCRWAAPRRPIERVLLVKFWGLGSLQLLTPAVRALRERHPGARLELLTLRQNAAFARGLRVFDEVLTMDLAGTGWIGLFARIVALVPGLRRRRYAAVYDFEFFTRFSAVVSILSGARESHGFTTRRLRRGYLHTQWAPFNRYWHVARNFRNLAGGENGRALEPGELAPFVVQPKHRAEATTLLFEHGFDDRGPLVVLNPNAGALSLERRWPSERFGELAQRLVGEHGARVVLVGSPAERDRAREVLQHALGSGSVDRTRIADLSGRLTIGGLAALLGNATAFVTNDSGPMHLAAALGVRTVGLFGPETPVMYAPIGRAATWLYEPPACSPCINVHENKLSVCVRGRAECLTNITVERVLATLALGDREADRARRAPRFTPG